MKNGCLRFCLLIFLCFFSLPCFCGDKLKLGFLAGLHINEPNGYTWDYHYGLGIQREEIYATDPSSNVTIAGFGTLQFMEHIFLRSCLSLSWGIYNMEYYRRSDASFQYRPYTVEFLAIDIPVMIGVGLFKNRLKIFAGPGYTHFKVEDTWDTDFQPNLFSFDVGIGFNITEKISLEMMSFHSITDMYRGTIGYLDLNPKMSRIGMTFGGAYHF